MSNRENKKAEEGSALYEAGFILVPSLAEEKLSEGAATIRTLVEKANGSVVSEDFPKLRPLAYNISRRDESSKNTYSEAFFGAIRFYLASAEIESFEKAIQNLPFVLRSVIFKLPADALSYEFRVEPNTAEAESSKEEATPNIDKSIDALVVN